MCKAFSCIVLPDRKVLWQMGVNSHSSLVETHHLKDNTADPAEMGFARVEITPDNGSYLEPDRWTLNVDEQIRPQWFGQRHEEACFDAHCKWVKQLDRVLIRKPIVHPFTLKPPAIGKKEIALLRQWASVWASVPASVWASVVDSVGDSVWASVWASVRASVWASVRASVGDSVWASVWDSVRAYSGSFFRLPRKAWKYTEKIKTTAYPFQPAVNLWEMGLVPSFDGTTWRLHGGLKGKVLYEITPEELRKK